MKMTEQHKRKISKFLSLILRHKPETIGLMLDKNGWALVSEILSKTQIVFTKDELEEVVETNDKQRFVFNNDKTKIRANQGHSIDSLDLELKKQKPPLYLYHGTVPKFIDSIKTKGLLKMNRQYVHLSEDIETAKRVANRRGIAIILKVKAEGLYKNKYEFYLSENDVWLTDNVPPKFIDFD